MGNNLAQMKKLMAEAEFFHSEILSIESQSEALLAGRPRTDQHVIYQVAKDLDNNFWYNRAISKRNAAINRAVMYGIAALLEKESGQ